MSEPPTMKPSMTVGFVAGFYLVLAGLAWLLARFFGDLNVLVWHNVHDVPLYVDAILGAGFGIVVVLASGLLDERAEWARRLGREFGRTLGALSTTDAFIFALASGIGEELFFRGFLQQLLTEVVFSGAWADWGGLVITSVVFGALHIGPDIKKFWPWTVMAIVLGAGFGWMYLYTGNVLAPILAHFTINFFNLQSIGRKYGHLKEQEQP